MSPSRIVNADPGFPYGGLSIGSKLVALSTMSASPLFDRLVATSILTPVKGSASQRTQMALHLMKKHRISFPIIIKPDLGHRGIGVRLITTQSGLERFLRKTAIPHIIQPYYAYPLEFGVFYIRFPGAKQGLVTGITQKILPEVVGDGKKTVRELICADATLLARKEKLFAQNHDLLDTVLPRMVKQKLLISGSHARGAIFLDASHLISPKISRTIDSLSRSASGFYFGRFDIKAKSVASFCEGKQFRIVEVNGVDSENTHIYDPKYSLFFAYKTLFHQWKTVFLIARAINRPAPSLLAMIREYRLLFAQLDSLPGHEEKF